MKKSFSTSLMIVFIGSLLNGCASLLSIIEEENEDVHLIQMHQHFQKRSLPIEKIISIEPDFLWVNQNWALGETVMNTEALEENYQGFLKQSALAHGITLTVAAPNTLKKDQIDYFNKLLPLKKQVLFANTSQKAFINDYKTIRTKNGDQAFFGKYPNEIEFDSEFGSLAKVYGTRYFSINGFVSVIDADNKNSGSSGFLSSEFMSPEAYEIYLRGNSKTLFYHILVDVKRSEILYREIRFFDEYYNTQLLQNLLLNSFKMITKE